MEIELDISNFKAVAKLEGILDESGQKKLSGVIKKLKGKKCKTLTMDLSGVQSAERTGLMALIDFFEKIESSGVEVEISAVNNDFRAIVRLLKLSRVIPI